MQKSSIWNESQACCEVFKIEISSRPFLFENEKKKKKKLLMIRQTRSDCKNMASVHFCDKVSNLIETVENWMNNFFNIQFPSFLIVLDL